MLSLLSRLVNATRTSARNDKARRRTTLRLESLENRLAMAGFEIAYIGNVGPEFKGPTQVYLAGGENAIPEDEWDAYVPPEGYVKNTTRRVVFDSQDVLSSPDSPTAETYITTTPDNYTWLFVAETVSANWPFDPADYTCDTSTGDTSTTCYTSGYEAAALTTTPPPGVVKYSANTKNALVTWLAKDKNGQPIERYFIRDAWGNTYIMQTSGATEQADVRSNFFSAELPQGWRMFAGYLKRNLTTNPAYDSNGFAQFNIFRTSADDAFQQITWSARGHSIARQIPDMIIWGGATSNTILARKGQANVIHGGQGNDRIVSLGSNDQIHGDDGFDTVVFRGRRSQYIVTPLADDGSLVEVRTRRGGANARVATLSNVEALRFRNRVERIADLVPSQSSIWSVYAMAPAPAVVPTTRVAHGPTRKPVSS